MRSLAKQIRNLVSALGIKAKNKTRSSGKDKIFVVGFSTWKTYLRKYFDDYDLVFLPKSIEKRQFNADYKRQILKNRSSCQVFIWGFKAPDYIFDFLKDNQIPTKFVEDGFVRSVQLGATKAPPMSLCLDSVTPYFDATKPSELETLLNNFDFREKQELLERAEAGIKLICDSGVSKYNNSSPVDINKFYGTKKTKRILVLGQVEDDASIKFGCEKQLTNNDVVRLAAKENPKAQIIYKPHPDVLNGHRPYQSNPQDVADICMVLTKDVPLANSLETVDHVYTITSLAGFEALMRGIKVTTLGCPFYSGWGLTDDRQPNSRRKRKLSVKELFAVSYLVYPKYFEPETGRETSFESVITVIKSTRTKDNSDTNVLKNDNALVFGLDVGSSVASLQNAIIDFPEDHSLRFKLAEYLFENLKYEEALELVETSIEMEAVPKYLQLKVDCLQKTGRFGPEIESCYFLAIDSAKGLLKDNLTYQYFSYKWEVSPLSDLTINQLKNYINRIPEGNKTTKAYGKLKLLLAAFLAESGQIKQALNLRREAKKIKAIDTNLMNLRYWARRRENPDAMSDYEYHGFKKLLSFKGKFESLVLEAGGDVCIVGNSPNLIGQGLGKMIDSHKLVIRFNSYNTSYPYCQDVGQKTDIWVRMPFHPYVKNQAENSHKLIMFTGSNRYNRPYSEWDGIFDLMNEGFPVEFFDPISFYELQAKVKSPPTAGLMLCYLLYKIIGPLKPENYHGFSFADDYLSQSDAYHYSDSTAKSSSRHNWNAEAEVFKSLVFTSENKENDVSRILSEYHESANNEITSECLNCTFSDEFIDTNHKYEGVLSISPGLKDYIIYDHAVDYTSAKAVEDYISYVESGGLNGKASQLLSNLNTRTCCVGFGRARTGLAAANIAKLLGLDFRLVEYGFISSMHLPSEKQFNFSLVLDDLGIFYDTTRPSRIENILNESNEILSAKSVLRAKEMMTKVIGNNITKYNNSADALLPEKKAARRILVIDQTANDNSILLGQCETYQFADMLQSALDQPDSEVFLKLHPETVAGAKDGNLTEINKHIKNEKLTLIDQQCNVVSLIKQVDEVYVMTSGVGFEALMVGKPVRCFGVPFYAGWGITTDMVPVKNTRRDLSVEALFAAVFFHYTVFFHPVTAQPCSMEECIEWIVHNKALLPMIEIGKNNG